LRVQLSGGGTLARLLAAAVAIPALSGEADAASAPDQGEVALRYSDYQDFQPGATRMQALTPALRVLAPFGDAWALDASFATDAVSGASPLYHDTLSGASGVGIKDFRRTGDVELTHFRDWGSLAAGIAVSNEDDYDAVAGRLVLTLDSADRNTSYSFGIGASDDTIDSTNDVANDEHRNTTDAEIGITRVLTPRSLLQASLSYSNGRGYFDDPYKPLDARPDRRRQRAFALRYNQYLVRFEAPLRLSYRWYGDSWDIDAHSLEAAWEQPFGDGWSLTPRLRYYTQSAADFYVDPPFGVGFEEGVPYSADTRLAAYGAIAFALELELPLGANWHADVKGEFYRQRPEWRAFGEGSPDIGELSARVIEVGFRYAF
jgi:hypothetical protein